MCIVPFKKNNNNIITTPVRFVLFSIFLQVWMVWSSWLWLVPDDAILKELCVVTDHLHLASLLSKFISLHIQSLRQLCGLSQTPSTNLMPSTHPFLCARDCLYPKAGLLKVRTPVRIRTGREFNLDPPPLDISSALVSLRPQAQGFAFLTQSFSTGRVSSVFKEPNRTAADFWMNEYKTAFPKAYHCWLSDIWTWM